jgi:hypothetical protein
MNTEDVSYRADVPCFPGWQNRARRARAAAAAGVERETAKDEHVQPDAAGSLTIAAAVLSASRHDSDRAALTR